MHRTLIAFQEIFQTTLLRLRSTLNACISFNISLKQFWIVWVENERSGYQQATSIIPQCTHHLIFDGCGPQSHEDFIVLKMVHHHNIEANCLEFNCLRCRKIILRRTQVVEAQIQQTISH
jgi:hypothetical protein